MLISLNTNIIFIVEDYNWSIKWDGKYITDNLKKLRLAKIEIGSPLFAKNKIVHFGSIGCLISFKGLAYLDKSNKHILTWFHIEKEDKRVKYIPLLNRKLDFIVTANKISRNNLIELGFDESKIIVIPLGVDLSIFKRYNQKYKNQIKESLELTQNKIIIGSFQKDGVGWGEGLEPKLIKGPDVFCEVVKKLKEKFDIHVFLTGPARGYVKNRLEQYKIPYTHIFLDNYLDIVKYYNILDLYIVTSRIEGGPKAILEGMATGVPIITTKVGMAPEIIKNGINGFLTDIDEIEQLYKYSVEIIKNQELRQKIIANGLKTIKEFSWESVAKQYYYNVYEKLLKKS